MHRLRYWVEHQPAELAYCFLEDGDHEETRLTYEQLDRKARAVARRLQQLRMTGQRALLLYPPGIDFLVGFFGCFYAGVVAVPAYPPRRNRNMHRIQAIADDAAARVALTVADVAERTTSLLEEDSSLKRLVWLATDTVSDDEADRWQTSAVTSSDLAVLQYTSGSTGTPKGVMLTHANIMHNCMLITTAFETGRDAFGMSWLPAYHDMGLVGGILNPLFCGRPTVLMSPMAFLQKPVRWLQVISRYRVTISGGPNFAYDLCTKKISDDELAGLDLSSWTLAFNGAEPVRRETLDKFSLKFAPCGFRREAFYPCYGMAETTLIVTGGARRKPPVIRCFDGSDLDEGRVMLAAPDGDRGRHVVSCGRVLQDETLVIVDPDTKTRLREDRVGEIWIHSPSVGQGYWDKPEATQETFRARLADDDSRTYLRSGDLGFFHDGELFVTGRIKDMIIVRGVNRYPQDIEMTVERADRRIRNGASAAFAVDMAGRERLVVVSEVERDGSNNWDEVIESIRRDVTTEHELPPDAVILVRSGSIPKTSSGKIQRHACRQSFLENSLLAVAQRCLWEQELPETRAPLEVREPAGPALATDHDDIQVLQAVMQQVRAVARERARELQPDTIIVDLGLDSLERMEIINALEEMFGGELPEEVLPRVETPRQVARAISQYLGVRRVDQPGRRRYGVIPPENCRFEQMTEYLQLKRTLALLQSTGLPNPYFPTHEGIARDTSVVEGRPRIDFSHYNYLGMSGDPQVTRAAQEAIEQFGTSVSASRLVAGQNPLHTQLEQELAQFIGTKAALVYVGAHAANETTIGHLLGAGDLILHDALVHNSVIQGAILSGARRRPFPHNDWQALDQVLRELRHDYRRVLVVIEGVYGMDGDFPDLPQFVAVKRRHQAFLMVDEAHSLGTLGATGRGLGELFGVDPTAVDLWMGTLSNALGSCGGYAAGCQEVIEYLKYTAPGFVHSVGLSPPNAAAALAALRLLRQEPQRVHRCIEQAQLFRQEAQRLRLDTGFSQNTPIVPLLVGNSVTALRLARNLFERGVCAQSLVYPAIEESAARLRFFIHSVHSREQILAAVQAVGEELTRIQPAYFAKSLRSAVAAGRDL